MTHALHRCGSAESLEGDYVLIAMGAKENRAAVAPGLAKAARILLETGPSNIGSSSLGMTALLGFDAEDFIARIVGSDAVACAFSSREKLRQAVARLKEADLGLSITVSGLTDEILPMARELGLRPDSINLSFGIMGETGGVAEERILELTTMCGHCRVSAELARSAVRNVAGGVQTPLQASQMLGRPCTCGLFNVDRSAALLAELSVERL